jgi:SAM-dependent methyltransferase
MKNYKLLSERFDKFKSVTGEEDIIINLIKSAVPMDIASEVLDIGSNNGKISHAIQPNSKNITLVDVEDFNIQTGASFLKGEWENIEISKKFDVILASHVWGHFYHSGTMRVAFEKAWNSTKKGGRLVLCYNTNEGILGELVGMCKSIFPDFMYDVFDESLLKDFKKKEIAFTILLKARSIEELVDLIHVLIIVPDEMYESNREKIKEYVQDKIPNLELEINQKIVIVEK